MKLHEGAAVIVHLSQPTEKFWGFLVALDLAGVTLRGINLSSFDEWMIQASRGEDQTLGLVTMFVPMARVERLFIDERVGEVKSYQERFQERVGVSVRRYLGLPELEPVDDEVEEIPS